MMGKLLVVVTAGAMAGASLVHAEAWRVGGVDRPVVVGQLRGPGNAGPSEGRYPHTTRPRPMRTTTHCTAWPRMPRLA